MLHIPLLRAGKPYKSLDVRHLPHVQTGEPIVEVSQANPGLIAMDLRLAARNKQILGKLSIEELLEICEKAAELFLNGDLPIGADIQSPKDYIKQLSATTGMPEVICRQNMGKIAFVLKDMPNVLGGLTRGLDLRALDSSWDTQNERMMSFVCQTNALGAILPSNSTGVHWQWLPAIPLKVPLILKPGSQEPWTPYRIGQAFMAAGCPGEAISYYPTDYSGATEILLRCERSLLFGDRNTVRPWEKQTGVQIHGPGLSKVVIGEDNIAQWQDYLDVIEASVMSNAGRTCLNASSVWVPARGRDIAEALAVRLAKIIPRAIDAPEAQLAAFVNKAIAQRISDTIDLQLSQTGAVDLTAKYRDSVSVTRSDSEVRASAGRSPALLQSADCPRLIEAQGMTFLLPTVIWCENSEHPLANSEFLFPFVSVVQVPQDELLKRIGPTLTLTAITKDPTFTRNLLAAPHINSLNLGLIPTTQISWTQPGEGNLFEHLYRQRSLQFLTR
jgi:acyl-CoA reductase-like NAD-dependent aldehyde dehydrogenase